MDYLITDGPGRAAFVRYWRLLALAVADHPSAVACEFMNEPMTIRRPLAFDTWRAAGEAVNAVIPDMAVSVMDTGEGVLLPSWLVNVTGGGGFISTDTLQWIKTARTVYYAWHWYGLPATPTEAVADAEALGESWGVPTIVRFFVITRANPVPPSSHPLPPLHPQRPRNTGTVWRTKRLRLPTFRACIGIVSFDANHARLYGTFTRLHPPNPTKTDSAYCTTGPSFGNRSVPNSTFGACILGWASGSTAGPCGP
jgi:hypothetical protein